VKWLTVIRRSLKRNFGSDYPETAINSAIKNLNVMPSMRCLMTAGPALERDNAAAFNCSALFIDHPRAFDELLYILMLRLPA